MNEFNMFDWTRFYTLLANKLLEFKNNRTELLTKLQSIFEKSDMNFPFIENKKGMEDICPFTVFGSFNKGIREENRINLLKLFAEEFEIDAAVPTSFDGIPVLNNLKAWFFVGYNDRKKEDIPNLWNMFEVAINYANEPNDENKNKFIKIYDIVKNQKGVKWNLSMGLFWIRPSAYLNLDQQNRAFLAKPDILVSPMGDTFNPEIKKVPDASTYLFMCEQCKLSFIQDTRDHAAKNFVSLSHAAWLSKDDNQDNVHNEDNEQTKVAKELNKLPKNMILYGPPGTGKTYNAVNYAVAIIEDKPIESVLEENYYGVLIRYNQYKEHGLIEFTTFHQSYGYEEFIEGIKPVMDEHNDESDDIKYQVASGIFKTFCDNASRLVSVDKKEDIGINKSPTVWKVSLEGTGDNPTRTECLNNNHIRIGWDSYGENITDKTDFSFEGGKTVLNAFINKMKIGDIVLSCYSASTIDAIGIVTGEYEWHPEYGNYKRIRPVNWLVKNIRYDIVEMNNDTTMTLSSVYKLNVSLADVMTILNETQESKTKQVIKPKNYVFIIDEINRGNISKVFGELITLIETSKRIGQAECIKVRLPYSKMPFGVPDNVYIIGTMNTADRSIALIDTALRRRFCFKEMQPDVTVLEDVFVGTLSIADMLDKINRRITVLCDREHTIGHAYFMSLKENPTIEQLSSIFKNSIMPLLQEYFYEDYEKIRLVLGDNSKVSDDQQFIILVTNDFLELFGDTEYDFDETSTYEINYPAFANIEAYKNI